MTQMTIEDWEGLRYFSRDEFKCSHTGRCLMQREFMEKLDELRDLCGFPFVITSGYRASTHPVEAKKPTGGGTHTLGIAADIRAADGKTRREIVVSALELGFTGIGVHKGFIHVDTRDTTPVLWPY